MARAQPSRWEEAIKEGPMNGRLWLTPLTLVIASTALAGPVDTAIPANPCTGQNLKTLKLILVAHPVGSGLDAETVVICHNANSVNPADMMVQLFNADGTLNRNSEERCNIPPGATAGFITSSTLPAPYTINNTSIVGFEAGTAMSELGSLRVLSTDTKTICDITLVDSSGATPSWTSRVTVTASSKPQAGD
jgi:hypothetical protein